MADNKVKTDVQPINIQSEIDAVNGARLGSIVRSSIANALKKIADSFNTVVTGYNQAAVDYNSMAQDAQEAHEHLNQFNTISVDVKFIGADGETVDKSKIPGYSNVTESGILERTPTASEFKFSFPYLKGDKGDNGTSQYIHVKYSKSGNKPSKSSDMADKPQTDSNGNPVTHWIGFLVNDSKTAPSTPSSYSWLYTKGQKGDTGEGFDDAKDLVAGQFRMRRVWALDDSELNKNGTTFMPCSKVDKNKVENSELAMVVFRRATGTDPQLYKYKGQNLTDQKYYNLTPTTKSPSFGTASLACEVSTVFVKKGDYADVTFNTFKGGTAVNRYVRWFKDNEKLTFGTGTHRTRSDGSTDGKDVFDKAFYFANARPVTKLNGITGDKDIYQTDKKPANEITKNDNAETENRTANQSAVPIAIYVLENVIDDDNIT